MHKAAQGGHVDVIKALKELGADVSTRDKAGRTPYYLAYAARQTLACDVLKALGSPSLSFVDRIKARRR
jgi:ankyrin repeat protein